MRAAGATTSFCAAMKPSPPPPRGTIACTADQGHALVGIGWTRAMNSARAASDASS